MVPASPPPLRPGQRLGPFVLIEAIAGGPSWLATLMDARGTRRVALHRFSPRGPARAALLEECRRAEGIRHPNVAPVVTTAEVGADVWVATEPSSGIDLATLLRELSARDAPMDLRLAVWIAREVVRILVEAGDAGAGSAPPAETSGAALGPSRVWIGPGGRVELAGTAGAGVRSAGVLLSEMSKARADAAPVLPRSVEALMQRAFSETDGFRDLGALEGALGRAFYGELGADDRTHGPGALAALVASLQPAVVARRESDRTDPEATPPVVPGDLTRALEARNRTVVPQPLAADDQPTGFGDRPAFRAATRPDASSLTSEHAPRRAAGPPPPSTGTGAPHSPPLYVPVPRPPMPIAARLFWFALGFIAAILLVTAHRIFSIPVPPAADPARPGAPAGR